MTDLRRLLLLALLLCGSQTLLAWHAPSHIELSDTGAGHVLALQDCQLGTQAHAPALPVAGISLDLPPAVQTLTARAVNATRHSHTLIARARAPPTLLS